MASGRIQDRVLLPRPDGPVIDEQVIPNRMFCGLWMVVATACGVLLTGCDPPHIPVCCRADFSFEMVNGTSERIRLQVAMIEGHFRDYPSVAGDDYSRTEIYEMNSGARRTFAMHSEYGVVDSATDGGYIRGLGAVYFYDELARIPYRGYVYLGSGCGVELTVCGASDDGKSIRHRSLDGTTESLFSESTERPFYLEVDSDNPDLGRLVITSVPTAIPDGPPVS